MALTERPHARLWQRLCRFHRAIWELHGRQFRRLAQYRFVHVVWTVPLLGILGPAFISAEHWPGWTLATVAWLSLVWRVSLQDDAHETPPSGPRAWWPPYDKAVSAGLVVCLMLTAVPLIVLVSKGTQIEPLLSILRSALGEAAACALVLSAIYYFFFGYLTGILRLILFWPRRAKRPDTRSGPSRQNARTTKWVTKSNLHLLILLSFTGLLLTAVPTYSASNLVFVLFLAFLPILFSRSPWVGNHRRSLVGILPHIYVVWFLGLGIHAGFLEMFSVGRYGPHVLRRVIDSIPDFGPYTADIPGLITIVCITIVLTAVSRLKGDLVIRQANPEGTAALSIHGNTRMYVDRDGYLENLVNYIRRSNSGVIGITGLRGAGKSALLNRIVAEFANQYAVVSMTAPVSHREGFGFLTSVCRAICRQAIEDVFPILYGRPRAWQQALGEFVRRSRGFLAIAILLVAIGWFARFGPDSPVSGVFDQSSFLPLPEKVRIGEAIVSANVFAYDISPIFHQVVRAERRSVAGLIERVAANLPKIGSEQEEPADGPYIAIVPITSQSGFDLIRVHPVEGGRRQLTRRGDWLAASVQSVDDSKTIGNLYEFMLSSHTVRFDRQMEEYWGATLGTPGNSEIGTFIRLQESFFRYVMGSRNIFTNMTEGDNGGKAVSDEFKATVSSLQFFRGHPALEGHLEAEIASLKELLGVDDPIVRDQELVSIVILSAFYQQIDRGTSESVKDYVLSQSELRELHGILLRYLALLDGKTLSKPNALGPGVSSMEADRMEDYWNRISAGVMSVWALLVVVGFLLIGRTIWRYGNFVTRAPLNASYLALVRASEEFLEFLDYSEGREASHGFSVRGLSFGARRVLTSRALTLQSLTDYYLGYVRTLRRHYNGKLVVVIDELDKVTDPLQVRDLLLELKGALFEEGCYYIISISEDAARAFRGRLSEGRDIFESSFDDIVMIEHMPVETARLMVQRRLSTDSSLPPISNASIDVLVMFSGGIPREIVRHLRESVMSGDGRSDCTPRYIGLQVMQSEVEKWLSRIVEAPLSGEDLVQLRSHGNEILSKLRTVTECLPWPAEVAACLKSSLAILDRGELRKTVDLASEREALADIVTARDGADSPNELRQLRIRMRRMAEVQACMRLLVMNAAMVHVWNGTEDAWRPLVPDIVECFRLVLQQPALAEEELLIIEDKLRASQ